MSRREKFGKPLKQYVRVGPAEIAYLEEGDAGSPPVVFIHGVTTNAALWQKVLKLTRGSVHGFAVDLMGLGDTRVSPYEDLSLPAQAEVLVEMLDRFGLESATFVAHDHGGAVAQIIAANQPKRVSSLMLVDTISHDHWPIPLVRQTMRIARLPGAAELLRATTLVRRSTLAWRLAVGPLGYASGYYNPDLIEGDLIREYLRPFTEEDGRERARRFLLAAEPRSTVEILPRLRAFTKPTRILWGADDRFLTPSWGIELADDIPGAEFHLLPFCGHFAPDERPELVAAHLEALVEQTSVPA